MSSKILGAVIGSLLFSSLSFSQTPDAATIAKGKRIWLSVCIQCHNRDPNLKGSIGPEVTDAPQEVMLAKVKTGKYPEKLPAGFTPKRKTKAMRALPKNVGDVPAIWAFVQSVKKKK